MSSQFKQDNPGCDCCGATCDTIESCECIQDGEAISFPPFQIKIEGLRHFSDPIETPPYCTFCDDIGVNGTWMQYDFCIDGTTVAQPTPSGTFNTNWFLVMSLVSQFDACSGLTFSIYFFIRVRRTSSTNFRVDFLMYEASIIYKWFFLDFPVTGCNCPDFSDTSEQSMDPFASQGQSACEYFNASGGVFFQWL